ncbi:MAG: hypothetical protein RL172_1469, partial [Bacteroidota bacterium]|jgi:hypothetical protein
MHPLFLVNKTHRSCIRFVFFALLLANKNLQAQMLTPFNTHTVQYLKPAGNIYPVNKTTPKKRFWRASGELMVAQLIPWSVNKFVRKAEFANISFSSIWHNLGNWQWDDNSFNTNQFAHPYHGNLYFNAFRTNGYNFWGSSLAAFSGSFLWETCGETHPPAPNDLINTSLGGIALGEMTYRLSQRIFNNRSHGFKRQVSEVGGFVVNPMGGLNRVIDGQWGRVTNTDPYENAPMALMVDMGGRKANATFKQAVNNGKAEFYTRLQLLYGEPFKNFNKPFSNFSVLAELGADDSAKLNTLQVNGLLYGKQMGAGKSSNNFLFITMNYDFYKNAVLNYGAQSFTAKFLSDKKIGKRSGMQFSGGAGIIALAAVPNKYLYYGEGRNYDYGPGVNLNASIGFNIANRVFYNLAYRGSWFSTINGARSNYFLHTSTSELRVAVNKHFSIGSEGGIFQFKGNFKDYADYENKYKFLRLYAGYRVVF